LKIFCS